jgi:hypothetical protein
VHHRSKATVRQSLVEEMHSVVGDAGAGCGGVEPGEPGGEEGVGWTREVRRRVSML